MRMIKDGDSNTHFFHLSTVIHRRQPYTRILGSQNNQIHDREDIGDAFEQFYKGLFNSVIPNFPIQFQGLVHSCIFYSINYSLIIVPTTKKIMDALSQMSSQVRWIHIDFFQDLLGDIERGNNQGYSTVFQHRTTQVCTELYLFSTYS